MVAKYRFAPVAKALSKWSARNFLKVTAGLVELLLPLRRRHELGRLQQRHADLVVDHLLKGFVGHRTGAHRLEIIECDVVELPLRIAQTIDKSLTTIPPKKRRTRQAETAGGHESGQQPHYAMPTSHPSTLIAFDIQKTLPMILQTRTG